MRIFGGSSLTSLVSTADWYVSRWLRQSTAEKIGSERFRKALIQTSSPSTASATSVPAGFVMSKNVAENWYSGAMKRRWAYFWAMLKDTGCLRVRMGGTAAGRRGVIADGWRRCSSNRVGTTDNDDFYTTDLLAKAVSLTFVKLPEFIHRLYVSSDHMSENLEGKNIKVKATDRRVEMYLPNALRVDIDSL